MMHVAITFAEQKTIMNNSNFSAIEAIEATEKSPQPAHNNGVTRAFARVLVRAFAASSDWLRQQHEIALRRPPAAVRMRSVNATPA